MCPLTASTQMPGMDGSGLYSWTDKKPRKAPTCDYCTSVEIEHKTIKCGSCKKTYKGNFCNECRKAVKEQDFCQGNIEAAETWSLS